MPCGNFFDLNTPSEVTIEQVATLIAEQFDYVDRIVFDDTYSDGQYKKTADNGKFKKILPDFQFMDIEQGVEDTIEYFKTNYDNCRR